MCKLSYEVIDFVDLLVDSRKQLELDAELDVPPELRSREKLMAALLCTTLAEYGFRYGAPPEQLIKWFLWSWNKRSLLALQGEQGPSELDKRLEDYES